MRLARSRARGGIVNLHRRDQPGQRRTRGHPGCPPAAAGATALVTSGKPDDLTALNAAAIAALTP